MWFVAVFVRTCRTMPRWLLTTMLFAAIFASVFIFFVTVAGPINSIPIPFLLWIGVIAALPAFLGARQISQWFAPSAPALAPRLDPADLQKAAKVRQRARRAAPRWLNRLALVMGFAAILLNFLSFLLPWDLEFRIMPFTFMLLIFGAISLIIWSNVSQSLGPPAPAPAPVARLDPVKVEEIAQSLSATLAELELVRAQVLRKLPARIVAELPRSIGIGAVIGLFLWFNSSWSTAPGFFKFALFAIIVGITALSSVLLASGKLDQDYSNLYKAKVLPRLLAEFGTLKFRQAALEQLPILNNRPIGESNVSIKVDDEIFGSHRGLAISIVETSVTQSNNKHTWVLFDGLLTTVELPRPLLASTTLISSKEDPNMFGDWCRGFRDGLQHVRLEDPDFERLYEVHGTDQIAARALLTPAFMERFLALYERGYPPAIVLAKGRQLTLALPKFRPGDLFDPPSFFQPARSREVLATIHADIAASLRAVDAVINLDQASRAQAQTLPAATTPLAW